MPDRLPLTRAFRPRSVADLSWYHKRRDGRIAGCPYSIGHRRLASGCAESLSILRCKNGLYRPRRTSLVGFQVLRFELRTPSDCWAGFLHGGSGARAPARRKTNERQATGSRRADVSRYNFCRLPKAETRLQEGLSNLRRIMCDVQRSSGRRLKSRFCSGNWRSPRSRPDTCRSTVGFCHGSGCRR